MNFRRAVLAASVAAAFAAPQEAQAMPALIVPTLIAAGMNVFFANVVAYIGVSFALSALSGMLSSAPTQPSFQSEARERTIVVRSAVATRRLVYGQSIVSGPLVYAESTTSGANLYHHYVIPLAAHECQEIGDVYFNDEVVGTLDGSGNVTSGTYNGVARIKKHLGATDQAADSDLVSASAGLWTTAHRLRGICYVYVRLLVSSTAFPNGIPNIKAVVKGKKVYDPRVAGSPTVTAYSANWALIVRDYLSSAYGLGCSDAEIDDTALIAAANTADELVSTSGASPPTTQARYTANGTVDLGDRPRDIMQQLLTAGAGACVYAQGVYRVLAGAYSTPAIAINADWLAGGVKVRPHMARQDLYNAVRGTYSDPNKQWQATDFSPQTSSTYETQDGGIQIARDIELPFTTSPIAAQRIAKLHLEKGRQSIAVQMTCNLKAFQVRVWDTVTVTLSTLGWASKVFLCTGWTLNEKGTIDLQLQEEASAAYNWDYTMLTTLPTPPDAAVSDGPPSYTYSTFDPAAKHGNIILSGGNLVATNNTSDGSPFSTLSLIFQASGGSPSILKYAEFTGAAGVAMWIGLAKSTLAYGSDGVYVGSDADSYSYRFEGEKVTSATPVAYGAAYGSSDVIGVLFDSQTGNLSFTKNGADQGVAFTGLSGSFCPAVSIGYTGAITANFGASAWAYAPPAGYVGWNV